MFSDRLWILKLVVAAGLFAGLSLHARKILQEHQPDVERVAVFSEQLHNRVLFAASRRVVASDPTGVEVMTPVGPLHLRTDEKPAVGSTVSAVVRVIGPRQLEVVRFKVHEDYRWKRAVTYIVSLLTVLAYFWLVRRRFRWAPEAGVFRSRY